MAQASQVTNAFTSLSIDGGQSIIGNTINKLSIQYGTSQASADACKHDILEHLSTEDTRSYVRKAIPGTSRWLVKCELFRSWLDSEGPALLWMNGGIGSGKSVMCRYLLDTGAFNAPGKHAFWLLFQEKKKDPMSASHALAALLHQILARHPEKDKLFAHVLPAWADHGRMLRTRLDVMWTVLVNISQDPLAGELVCMIDGLDKCEKRSQQALLDAVVQLLESNAPAETETQDEQAQEETCEEEGAPGPAEEAAEEITPDTTTTDDDDDDDDGNGGDDGDDGAETTGDEAVPDDNQGDATAESESPGRPLPSLKIFVSSRRTRIIKDMLYPLNHTPSYYDCDMDIEESFADLGNEINIMGKEAMRRYLPERLVNKWLGSK